jgi:hypothetical protein
LRIANVKKVHSFLSVQEKISLIIFKVDFDDVDYATGISS